MKIPLTILAITALAMGSMYLFAPEPDPELLEARTDLPWQIQVQEDGTSRVLDVHLGVDTLADVTEKFGAVEDYAVFLRNEQESDLEAYFGNVMFGLLKAKVVVTLEASDADKKQLVKNARERKASPTGDWKYLLNKQDTTAQSGRKVQAISYVPGTRSLDRTFFLERFGEPAATLRENEKAVSWFYPGKGVTILIDEKGREVFEYVAPKDFVMPEGVTAYVRD